MNKEELTQLSFEQLTKKRKSLSWGCRVMFGVICVMCGLQLFQIFIVKKDWTLGNAIPLLFLVVLMNFKKDLDEVKAELQAREKKG